MPLTGFKEFRLEANDSDLEIEDDSGPSTSTARGGHPVIELGEDEDEDRVLFVPTESSPRTHSSYKGKGKGVLREKGGNWQTGRTGDMSRSVAGNLGRQGRRQLGDGEGFSNDRRGGGKSGGIAFEPARTMEELTGIKEPKSKKPRNNGMSPYIAAPRTKLPTFKKINQTQSVFGDDFDHKMDRVSKPGERAGEEKVKAMRAERKVAKRGETERISTSTPFSGKGKGKAKEENDVTVIDSDDSIAEFSDREAGPSSRALPSEKQSSPELSVPGAYPGDSPDPLLLKSNERPPLNLDRRPAPSEFHYTDSRDIDVTGVRPGTVKDRVKEFNEKSGKPEEPGDEREPPSKSTKPLDQALPPLSKSVPARGELVSVPLDYCRIGQTVLETDHQLVMKNTSLKFQDVESKNISGTLDLKDIETAQVSTFEKEKKAFEPLILYLKPSKGSDIGKKRPMGLDPASSDYMRSSIFVRIDVNSRDFDEADCRQILGGFKRLREGTTSFVDRSASKSLLRTEETLAKASSSARSAKQSATSKAEEDAATSKPRRKPRATVGAKEEAAANAAKDGKDRQMKLTAMLKGSSSNGRQTRNSLASAEQFSTEFEETEPAEVPSAASRRSERRIKAASPMLLDLPDPDEKILIYPFEGTGSVSITNADLARLQEGEFLNDTLIEFGLKLMFDRLKISTPNIQDEVYIFNSFFYKKLTQKPTAGTTSYQSVKKWTSKVDLFSKKFIVVPINEFLHWYVAIVCFPDRILAPPPPKPESKKKFTRSSAAMAEKRTPDPEEENEPVVASPFFSLKKATPRNDPSEVKLAGGDKQGAGVEDEVMAVESTAADDGKKAAVQSEDVQMDDSSSGPSDVGAIVVKMKAETEFEGGVEEEGYLIEQEDIEMKASELHLPTASVETSGGQGTPAAEEVMSISPEGLVAEALKGSQGPGEEERKLPYIFIWDSLGSKHQKVVRVLKNYFDEEARERKQMGANSAQAMICQYPRAPQQPNHCDCGLYLLHNVESFLQASTALFHHITAKTDREDLPEYRGDEVSTKRMSMRGEIGKLGEEWKQHLKSKQEAEEKEKEKAKNDGKDEEKRHQEKEGKDEEKEQAKKDFEERGSATDMERVTKDADAITIKRRHDGSFGAQVGAPLEGGQDGSDQIGDGGGKADAGEGGGLGAMIEIRRATKEKDGEVFSTESGKERVLGAGQGVWMLDPTTQRELEEHQHLFKDMDDPVQHPSSNGTVEVGIGALAAKRASKSAGTTEPVLVPSTSESPEHTQAREELPDFDSSPVKSSRHNRKRGAMEMQLLSDTSEQGSEEPIPIPTSSPIEDTDTQADRVRRGDGEPENDEFLSFGQTDPHSHQSTPKKRKRAKRGLESGGTADGREGIVIDLSGSPT